MMGSYTSADPVVTSVAPASPAAFTMHFGAKYAGHIQGAIADYFQSLTGHTATAGTDDWEVRNLSNGGVFMCPSTPAGQPTPLLRLSHHGQILEVNPQAAGVLACLCAYSAWLGITGNRAFAFHYEHLRDFAASLPEAECILRAIDRQPFSF